MMRKLLSILLIVFMFLASAAKINFIYADEDDEGYEGSEVYD